MNLWKNIPLKPMLLEELDKPFNDKNYIYEIKFDGIRAIIYASPKSLTIYSRNGLNITHLYPELQIIKNLVTVKTIFDGEIVLFDNDRPSFKKLLQRNNMKSEIRIKRCAENNPVTFVCFDILFENKDLTNLTLLERKKILAKYSENEYFNKTFFIEEQGINLFNEIVKLELEGIVAKRKDSIYEIGERSNSWVKIKNIKDDEFFIGGYIINKNTLSLLLGEKKNNKLLYVGKVTVGQKYELSKKILKEQKQKKSPFMDYNEKNIIYVFPQIKIKVNYLEKTKNNHLRHPFI